MALIWAELRLAACVNAGETSRPRESTAPKIYFFIAGYIGVIRKEYHA
jgi:hypothetical protein